MEELELETLVDSDDWLEGVDKLDGLDSDEVEELELKAPSSSRTR